jgi:hypothetical protein
MQLLKGFKGGGGMIGGGFVCIKRGVSYPFSFDMASTNMHVMKWCCAGLGQGRPPCHEDELSIPLLFSCVACFIAQREAAAGPHSKQEGGG